MVSRAVGCDNGTEGQCALIYPYAGVDATTSAVLERLELPAGEAISGLEADGAGRFYCGGGSSGKVLAVRRPARIPKSERR